MRVCALCVCLCAYLLIFLHNMTSQEQMEKCVRKNSYPWQTIKQLSPGWMEKNPIDPCDIIALTRHRGEWNHTKFGIEVHFINLYKNIIIIDLLSIIIINVKLYTYVTVRISLLIIL